MRNIKDLFCTISVVALLAVLMSTGVYAQEAAANVKQDKTGTNPINFQREFRIINEYISLNTEGDGSQNLTTVDFRTPFLDDKWQWRLRARYNSLTVDSNDDGDDDIDESGMGDMDMRFLTVPIVDMPNKIAFAFGLELFFDTASNDALGSGSTSLGPQVFYVKLLEGIRNLTESRQRSQYFPFPSVAH